jgi:hypothetical protein
MQHSGEFRSTTLELGAGIEVSVRCAADVAQIRSLKE